MIVLKTTQDFFFWLTWTKWGVFILAKRPSDYSDLDKTTCKSGVYKIYPKNTSGFEVYCEMEKNGGGWTVSGDMLFAALIKW